MFSLTLPTSQNTPEDFDTKTRPGPRGVVFIPLRDAAYRSGLAMETLAARCRGDWSENGLAKL